MQTSKKPRVWIQGCSGRMGQELQGLLHSDAQASFVYAGGSSKDQGWEEFAAQRSSVDIVVDFSLPEGNRRLLQEVQKSPASLRGVLIGTTGLDTAVIMQWKKLAAKGSLRVLLAPNTSMGISLVLKSALQVLGPCVAHNFDIEIGETHHRGKKDAPSGTALFLAEELAAHLPGAQLVSQRQGQRTQGEIGISSMRGGGVGGEHQIRFLGDDEEITISHRAYSRRVFARGALLLSSWLLAQPAGFYTLQNVEF